MGLIIEQIEYYLPEKVVTNEDLQRDNPEWDIKKIQEKSGVVSRHIAAPSETAFDLAVKAVEKLFSSGDINKNDIKAIMFCTQSPDYIMPSNSFLVHKYFNFSEDVWTFDYDLACSGYIFGLAFIRGILETNLAGNILLITSDTYSKYINEKDRSTKVLFGDAAAASIITSHGERGIIDIILSSSGSKYDTFYIPAGGCKIPKNDQSKQITKDLSGNSRTLEDIHMNGFAVWQFISKKVTEQITKLLKKNNLTVDDIDLFIFHQASKLTLDSLIKALNIDNNKAYSNLENIGNTVSASIPMALKDAETDRKLKRGDLILLSGFGVGLSWGSLIMKY